MSTQGAALVWPGLLHGVTDFSTLAWQSFHPGVEIVELYPPTADGAHAALLRYEPGACVPLHVHAGMEHILVLQGSQWDEHGEYRAGTLVVNRPGTRHRVCSDEGCVVLAIWQRPVQLLPSSD